MITTNQELAKATPRSATTCRACGIESSHAVVLVEFNQVPCLECAGEGLPLHNHIEPVCHECRRQLTLARGRHWYWTRRN